MPLVEVTSAPDPVKSAQFVTRRAVPSMLEVLLINSLTRMSKFAVYSPEQLEAHVEKLDLVLSHGLSQEVSSTENSTQSRTEAMGAGSKGSGG